MSVLLDLPTRPDGIRPLTDEQAARLRKFHPRLPRSLDECITCGGAKVFRWKDEAGNPADYRCNCRDQWIMHRYFLHSGLGKMYQRLSWTDAVAVDKRTMSEVFDYLDHADAFMRSGRGLILRSPQRGNGKTLVAALLFKAMLAKGHDGYFTQFNELLDAASAGWRDEEERAWFIRRVRNAGVLVIDDVGRENAETSARGLGMVEATFDKVIRARHDDALPTIITTNKTEEEWEKKYQSNILSLLSGTCRTVQVTGGDYRPVFNAQQDQEDRLGLIRPVVVG